MSDRTDVFHVVTRANRATAPRERLPAGISGNGSSRAVVSALIASAVLTPTVSFAAPLVFEETAKITSPDPRYRFPERIAVDGDTIIATGIRFDGDIEFNTVFLFQRQSNGTWAYVSTLAEGSCNSGEGAEDTCNAAVGMRNGLAVVAAGGVHVFTRATNGTWVAAPTEASSGPGDAAVGTNAVLTGESSSCAWSSQVLTENSVGVWTVAATMPGPSAPCDPWGIVGSDVDMSAGNNVILGNSMLEEDVVHIHEPSATTWTHTASLTSPIDGYVFGDTVAIDDDRAFVSGTSDTPIHVFSRSTGAWLPFVNIAPPDSARHQWPFAMKIRGDLLVAGFGDDPHRGGSVGVFEETSSGSYEQVARLVPSDSGSQPVYLGQDVDIAVSNSSARVVAAAEGAVYVFDLDSWGTTPAPLQDDFESGNAASWTPMAGSSFSVVTSSGTRVYRQSSVVGDAGSFVTGIDWTDQAIEADVKPTGFDGTGRWVGLAVRRTDANNYYYATLRQSNVLEIKRIVNGTFVTLASTPLPVTLNRTYRLRLEAVGTLIRAYVDGRLASQAHDTQLTHGHAGLRMYKARADFDNVILSQNPHLTLLDHRTNFLIENRWALGPGAWSFDYSSSSQRLVQQDTSGDARAVALVDANDQIVQVRAAANTFAGGTGSRWFGVLARYRDAGNYYYVTVRSDNTISLRKLLNGTISVLDTASLGVSAGTSYTLRLEAIGNSLRVYVNGRVVLEANDTSHPSGRYGLATYKTAATYDDFVAWEP